MRFNSGLTSVRSPISRAGRVAVQDPAAGRRGHCGAVGLVPIGRAGQLRGGETTDYFSSEPMEAAVHEVIVSIRLDCYVTEWREAFALEDGEINIHRTTCFSRTDDLRVRLADLGLVEGGLSDRENHAGDSTRLMIEALCNEAVMACRAKRATNHMQYFLQTLLLNNKFVQRGWNAVSDIDMLFGSFS